MNRLATQAFRDDVSAAKEGVEMLLKAHRDDQMLASIAAQLDFVLTWSETGADLNHPQLGDLNFGLMASHSVEDLDAELSMHLHLISHEINEASPRE